MTEKIKVELELTPSQLEGLSTDLADLLCWIRGFNIGCKVGDEFAEGYPFDVEALRTLSNGLKRALFARDAAGIPRTAPEPLEIPF